MRFAPQSYLRDAGGVLGGGSRHARVNHPSPGVKRGPHTLLNSDKKQHYPGGAGQGFKLSLWITGGWNAWEIPWKRRWLDVNRSLAGRRRGAACTGEWTCGIGGIWMSEMFQPPTANFSFLLRQTIFIFFYFQIFVEEGLSHSWKRKNWQCSSQLKK